jgi:hypothetical protein
LNRPTRAAGDVDTIRVTNREPERHDMRDGEGDAAIEAIQVRR